MKMRPLHDRVLIKRIDEQETVRRRDHHSGLSEREAPGRRGGRRRKWQAA